MPEAKPAHSRVMSELTAVLIACCLAMLAVGDNSTAIMAALPAMTNGLQLGAAEVEWVVNAYLLAAAVFIILGGEAADRFGARYSSTVGIGVFALASLLIAVAPAGIVVIGARALQGLGGAFAVAGTLAAVSEAAPDSKRAQAISAWTGFLMLGFSIGPLVGGVMTHYAGWRSNFWLNVVVLVPAALMLWRRPRSGGGRTRSMDWTGLGVLAVFMVTLVSGLHSLATVRSTPLAAIVELALAAFAFAVLIRAERRHPLPLVDLGVFSHRNFAVASGLVFLLMFDIMTFLLYFNLFAQSPDGLGMSAVGAGLALVPLSIALFGFARAAPWLAGAVGLRRLLIVSSLLLALGCAIAWVSSAAHVHMTTLMLGLFAIGCNSLCVGSPRRPRDAAAHASREGLRHTQFVQLSRRHDWRYLRRDRFRARRFPRRAGDARPLGIRRRGALLAAADRIKARPPYLAAVVLCGRSGMGLLTRSPT